MLLCPSSLTCLQCYDKENRLVSNPCLKSSTHLRIKSDIPACHTSSSALQFPLAPSLPTRVPVSDQTIFTSNTSPCSHLAQCLCICHHPSSLARDLGINLAGRVPVTLHSQVRGLSRFPLPGYILSVLQFPVDWFFSLMRLKTDCARHTVGAQHMILK